MAERTKIPVDQLAIGYPAILNIKQLAEILGRSPKTIYEWMARGRLDGCFRKRGKHILVARDRALDRIFNGREWGNEQ
jgi:predicted site-specific integrase-resolvase